MGSAHRAGWFRGEFYMPLPGAAKTVQPGFAQGAADWRSGPRWSILSVLCLVHPFASSRHFPSRGNKEFEEKNRESYTSCTTPAFPPLVAAPPPCPVGSMSLDSQSPTAPYESSSFATPASGGTIKLREAIFFIKWFYAKHGLFCSRLRGKSRAAGKGEANAVSQSAECFSYYMIHKANPVTLTLYSSPCGRYHNPRAKGPSNLRTLRTLGAQPRQPSRRRRVHWRPCHLFFYIFITSHSM